MGSLLYKSLTVKLNSANEFLFLKAYQLCVPISCFKMMSFMFSNLTILTKDGYIFDYQRLKKRQALIN